MSIHLKALPSSSMVCGAGAATEEVRVAICAPVEMTSGILAGIEALVTDVHTESRVFATVSFDREL